ncbi:hypothetical protein L289_3946 [Acinetobacter gerneri DSM 14967 = CIP 107464 = MTCC 9824]|nr:hypothetical protein L289_3946 [Acinetobacter gerneri DSM 14967 = CIP 107464 = MTCC 9824]
MSQTEASISSIFKKIKFLILHQRLNHLIFENNFKSCNVFIQNKFK